ncbi:hypothetical protein BGZ65_001629, partial [Modicella reniformis]
NLEIVREIPTGRSLDAMLTAYRNKASSLSGEAIARTKFDNAKGIFSSHVENIDAPPTIIGNYDFLRGQNRFQELKQVRFN